MGFCRPQAEPASAWIKPASADVTNGLAATNSRSWDRWFGWVGLACVPQVPLETGSISRLGGLWGTKTIASWNPLTCAELPNLIDSCMQCRAGVCYRLGLDSTMEFPVQVPRVRCWENHGQGPRTTDRRPRTTDDLVNSLTSGCAKTRAGRYNLGSTRFKLDACQGSLSG
jgi:hypothetical protein